MKKIIFLLVAIILCSCTSVKVNQIDASYEMNHVCIEHNPKVIVPHFLTTVESVFQQHGITIEQYTETLPAHCEFKLTYTALRSWDITTYLSHAELKLFRDNKQIGYAEYHLKGKGGFALNKWASVKSKMTPVVNQLLAAYKK